MLANKEMELTKSKTMRRLLIAVGIFIALFAAYFIVQFTAIVDSALTETVNYELGEIVVVSRSPNWKYGKGFYVAVVTAVKKKESKYFARCKVHVGNHNYFQNVELGEVNSFQEAIERWGELTWTNDQLYIGSKGPYQKVVARKNIERHR